MKQSIYLGFSILIIFSSCKTAFDSPTQAKNEVNKKGYREGKWVEYYDSTGQIRDTSINYDYYILSEWEDGIPSREFRQFNKNGQLRASINVNTSDKSKKFEKEPSFRWKVKNVTSYYENNEIKLIRHLYDNIQKDSSVEEFTSNGFRFRRVNSIEYHENGNLKSSKSIFYIPNSKDSIKFDKYLDKDGFSSYLDVTKLNSEFQNKYNEIDNFLKRKYRNIYNDTLIYNNIMYYHIFNQNQFNDKLKYVVFNEIDTLLVSQPLVEKMVDKLVDDAINKIKVENKTNNNNYTISEESFCDNASKYINKNINIILFYNNEISLRNQGYNFERMSSMTNYEIFGDSNETYYTREANSDCPIILRIPYNISVPNLKIGNLRINAEVSDSRTLIVKSITRY